MPIQRRLPAVLRFTALLSLGTLGALAHAQITALPEARASAAQNSYRHASECVAVLKAETHTLLNAYLDGQSARREAMDQMTGEGFAFIGTAYKQGLRNPEADRLLKEAEQSVAQLPAGPRDQLLSGCRKEGAALLEDASGIERALVRNRAKARVDRQIEKARKARTPAAGASTGG